MDEPRTRADIDAEIADLTVARHVPLTSNVIGRAIDQRIATLTAERDALPVEDEALLSVDDALATWHLAKRAYDELDDYERAEPAAANIIRAYGDKRAAVVEATLERVRGIFMLGPDDVTRECLDPLFTEPSS